MFKIQIGPANRSWLNDEGAWIELPATKETIDAAFAKIGCHENSDDWYIADFRVSHGLYFEISDREDFALLNRIADRLNALPEEKGLIIDTYLDAYGADLETALDCLDHADELEVYYGYDMEDLAEKFVREGRYGKIPEEALKYIDWGKIISELEEIYEETEPLDRPTGTIREEVYRKLTSIVDPEK